ncbi:MAG: Glyoxalase-like domain protein [bacterium ADurb.BinA186]|nr:MAG: Glyoxalase-like domain protein [bacterium ADurb.BinA186]
MQFNHLVPELSVSDLNKSLQFYVETIGFKIEYRRDESKFAFLSLEESQLMLSERNGHWETGIFEYPFGRGINFQILVSNIDPILKLLAAQAYPLMKAPWESWYRKDDQQVGQSEFLVQDPDGYLLRFAQHLGIRQLSVSEPSHESG